MDKAIVDFINEHHLLTLATCKANVAYCCNVYYVFNKENNSFIFSSDTKTKHAQDFIANPNVAGAIALETKEISKIQGVQLLGKIKELKAEELKIAKEQYVKAYPYARLMETHLWKIELTFAKMTHNSLGFGKKLIWES
jgi:hypothetical protein